MKADSVFWCLVTPKGATRGLKPITEKKKKTDILIYYFKIIEIFMYKKLPFLLLEWCNFPVTYRVKQRHTDMAFPLHKDGTVPCCGPQYSSVLVHFSFPCHFQNYWTLYRCTCVTIATATIETSCKGSSLSTQQNSLHLS